MNTTVAEFQNKFSQMRDLADAGQTVVIQTDNKTYEFRVSQDPAHDPLAEWRKTKGALLGCMKGRGDTSKLPPPEEPAIPVEEWGELWSS